MLGLGQKCQLMLLHQQIVLSALYKQTLAAGRGSVHLHYTDTALDSEAWLLRHADLEINSVSIHLHKCIQTANIVTAHFIQIITLW